MFIDGQGHSSGVPVYLLNSRCEQCELFHIWCTADVTVSSESCKRLKYPSLFSCQLSPVLPVTYCTTRLLLLLFSSQLSPVLPVTYCTTRLLLLLFSSQLSPVLPVTYCTTRLLLLLFSCTHLRATNGDLPEKNLSFLSPVRGL